MTNKKTIALIVGSTLLLGVLVYWIIGLLSFSTYTKPLIKFEEVINGATIRIEESLGGATSSDYLLVYQNDSLIKREKIADPIIIDKVVSKDDSLFVYFADSVYFITYGEWHNCRVL